MRFDRPALVVGAVVAAVIAAPLGVIAAVSDGAGGLTLLILVGLLVGAAVAAARQTAGTPLAHGIVAAVLAFVVVQFAGLVRRTTAGEGVGWGRIVSSLLLTVLVGTVGGLIGGAVGSRRRRAVPGGPPSDGAPFQGGT